MVPLACRSEGDYRELAAALQRGAPAFEARLSDAERIRGATDQRSAWQSNGPGRCGTWAFAPRPVAPPASREANAANNGRRLKLAVVRRNWAGQLHLAKQPQARAVLHLSRIGPLAPRINRRLGIPASHWGFRRPASTGRAQRPLHTKIKRTAPRAILKR